MVLESEAHVGNQIGSGAVRLVDGPSCTIVGGLVGAAPANTSFVRPTSSSVLLSDGRVLHCFHTKASTALATRVWLGEAPDEETYAAGDGVTDNVRCIAEMTAGVGDGMQVVGSVCITPDGDLWLGLTATYGTLTLDATVVPYVEPAYVAPGADWYAWADTVFEPDVITDPSTLLTYKNAKGCMAWFVSTDDGATWEQASDRWHHNTLRTWLPPTYASASSYTDEETLSASDPTNLSPLGAILELDSGDWVATCAYMSNKHGLTWEADDNGYLNYHAGAGTGGSFEPRHLLGVAKCGADRSSWSVPGPTWTGTAATDYTEEHAPYYDNGYNRNGCFHSMRLVESHGQIHLWTTDGDIVGNDAILLLIDPDTFAETSRDTLALSTFDVRATAGAIGSAMDGHALWLVTDGSQDAMISDRDGADAIGDLTIVMVDSIVGGGTGTDGVRHWWMGELYAYFQGPTHMVILGIDPEWSVDYICLPTA